jgi:predicted DNA-binding WGR domain protein
VDLTYIAFGAILATVLSLIQTWVTERRTDRKTASRVRTVISVEIDQNITLAETYLGQLTRDYYEYDGDYREPDWDEVALFRAHRLRTLPLPPWRHSMWQSQLSELTMAMNQEQISRCHAHHGYLDTVASIKATLDSFWREQQEASTAFAQLPEEERKKRYQNRSYSENVDELWAQVENALKELIELGNPLTYVKNMSKIQRPSVDSESNR